MKLSKFRAFKEDTLFRYHVETTTVQLLMSKVICILGVEVKLPNSTKANAAMVTQNSKSAQREFLHSRTNGFKKSLVELSTLLC